MTVLYKIYDTMYKNKTENESLKEIKEKYNRCVSYDYSELNKV